VRWYVLLTDIDDLKRGRGGPPRKGVARVSLDRRTAFQGWSSPLAPDGEVEFVQPAKALSSLASRLEELKHLGNQTGAITPPMIFRALIEDFTRRDGVGPPFRVGKYVVDVFDGVYRWFQSSRISASGRQRMHRPAGTTSLSTLTNASAPRRSFEVRTTIFGDGPASSAQTG